MEAKLKKENAYVPHALDLNLQQFPIESEQNDLNCGNIEQMAF